MMKKEIMIGKSRANYGEDVIEGVTLFKDEKTDEVTGVGILNFKERIKNKDINLPVDISFISSKNR